MAEQSATEVTSVIIDFLLSAPSHQAILEFHLSSELETRAEYLLERHRHDQLTASEAGEMRAYVWADDLMSLLKANVRRKLSG